MLHLEVRGVLGEDALPESALEMVKAHDMISIQSRLLGWSVVDERCSHTFIETTTQ